MKGSPMARNYGAPFKKPDGEDHSGESHKGTKGHHDPVEAKDPDAVTRTKQELEEASKKADEGSKKLDLATASIEKIRPGYPISQKHRDNQQDRANNIYNDSLRELERAKKELVEPKKGSGKPGPHEY